MAFRLRIDSVAQRNMNEFASYLREYSVQFADEQLGQLDRILHNIAESPLMWSYFALIGAPYRAYLFRVGRRTQYWIIYTVDADSRTVDVLDFWHAGRDPETLDL